MPYSINTPATCIELFFLERQCFTEALVKTPKRNSFIKPTVFFIEHPSQSVKSYALIEHPSIAANFFVEQEKHFNNSNMVTGARSLGVA